MNDITYLALVFPVHLSDGGTRHNFRCKPKGKELQEYSAIVDMVRQRVELTVLHTKEVLCIPLTNVAFYKEEARIEVPPVTGKGKSQQVVA